MMRSRELLACVALVGVAALPPDASVARGGEGRLRARPGATSTTTLPQGRQSLGLGTDRDGVIYVPRAAEGTARVPLVVMLHGAGGRGRISDTLQTLADEIGAVILAPDSRDVTWGIVRDRPGPDVEFIDRALAYTFTRCAVDPGRLALAGFSDGASCALWLGTINGDLFTHVIGFSPGYLAPGPRRGSPRLFISHGTRDEILPIDMTSRVFAPQLQEAGYRVTYREFDGPHAVPPAMARAAFEWFVK